MIQGFTSLRGSRLAIAAARHVARAWRVERDRRLLLSMSDHQLQDIGISRSQIDMAVAGYDHDSIRRPAF